MARRRRLSITPVLGHQRVHAAEHDAKLINFRERCARLRHTGTLPGPTGFASPLPSRNLPLSLIQNAHLLANNAALANHGIDMSNDGGSTLSIERSLTPVAAGERERLLQNPAFGRVFTDHMATSRYT